MRTAIIVSVTETGQLELPPELQAKLHPGDEYLVWETEDTILFKKVQKPLQFSDLLQRIETLGPDMEQPTLEAISKIVREARQQSTTGSTTPPCWRSLSAGYRGRSLSLNRSSRQLACYFWAVLAKMKAVLRILDFCKI